MLKLEDERRSVCSMLGYDTDLAGLAKLIAWCDPRRSLAAALRRVRAARAPLPRPQRPQRHPGRRADQARRRLLGASPARRAARLRPAPGRAYGGPAGQVISAEA
jgi:hypothetical protein